jgi:hypothetical protein
MTEEQEDILRLLAEEKLWNGLLISLAISSIVFLTFMQQSRRMDNLKHITIALLIAIAIGLIVINTFDIYNARILTQTFSKATSFESNLRMMCKVPSWIPRRKSWCRGPCCIYET